MTTAYPLARPKGIAINKIYLLTMTKKKKAQLANETMMWVIGIIIALIMLGAMYFLFKFLKIF